MRGKRGKRGRNEGENLSKIWRTTVERGGK